MRLSVFFKKTFAGQKLRVSQAGQAVVEYLLMLVMTVSIILGILYQFNDAFKNFLDSYFGDYIACLLETGELPSLGGQGPNQSECNRGFASFSLANGRPAKTSSGGGSSGSDSSNTPPSTTSTNGSTGDKGSRPSRFNSSNAPANAEASSGSSSRDRPARQNVSNNQQGGDDKGINGGAADGGLGGGGRTIKSKRIIYLGDEYLTKDAINKKDRKITGGKRSQKAQEMINLRKARFELHVPEAKRTLAMEEDTNRFSFGFFIKILLIGGIIIVLLIFLGGQALQIKKSWQKSE